ncbi:hypothetical protein B0T11DRAFT_66629 [Plectosphaerella cucumerina]|uniref:Uncharacterized protein n=1 Tax=Plectosphaerella cucumerina TaxID=40658 RepID=A0A8K0TSK9_9PEZI|nr:hypothetical protein B0T11DRAFT_66629 [Plectosphaerella cucumerina]
MRHRLPGRLMFLESLCGFCSRSAGARAGGSVNLASTHRTSSESRPHGTSTVPGPMELSRPLLSCAKTGRRRPGLTCSLDDRCPRPSSPRQISIHWRGLASQASLIPRLESRRQKLGPCVVPGGSLHRHKQGAHSSQEHLEPQSRGCAGESSRPRCAALSSWSRLVGHRFLLALR